MESLSKNNSAENMQESKSTTKGKSRVANVFIKRGIMKKKLSLLDLILRIGAAVSTMAATVIMGTLDVHLPFFTQFVQFEAQYDDLPPFQYFMYCNAIACGFIIIVSLPLSVVCILRPHAVRVRLFLVIFDTVFLTLVTSAAAAGADSVYLAHNGNSNTNWQAFCNQYSDFCQNSSSAVVASFVAIVFMIVLVTVSAIALRRRKTLNIN